MSVVSLPVLLLVYTAVAFSHCHNLHAWGHVLIVTKSVTMDVYMSCTCSGSMIVSLVWLIMHEVVQVVVVEEGSGNVSAKTQVWWIVKG